MDFDKLAAQLTSLSKTAIDTSEPSLRYAILAIAFNPIAWNIVARNEYRNQTMTRIFGGNARYACYILALCIFSAGIFRDNIYHHALMQQPQIPLLTGSLAYIVPVLLIGVGQLLVISSTWALGITGTFLGDYFGILMDSRVEGFPFNICNDPMYIGSTLTFFGGAFWYERPAGLLIALYVYIVYVIALRFEGPFTTAIYDKRAAAQAAKKD